MRRIIPIFLFLAVLIFIIFSSPICLAEGGDLDEYMSYYVQVPAQLKPGETGTVFASGMWGTGETLKVTTDDTVTLSYEDQTLVLSVYFDGINEVGQDGTPMQIESLISIEDKEVMFGEWVGHITYNVELLVN